MQYYDEASFKSVSTGSGNNILMKVVGEIVVGSRRVLALES